MLDKLISKLSLSGSGSGSGGQDAHPHSRFQTDINLYPERCERTPRIGPDVSYFLSMKGEDVQEILKKPAISVPEYYDSLPLASYCVSTSHNTYLLGDQLWGKSSASSYTHVLTNGAHCVEIDVWPSPSGPIVTHGWTLTSDILFKDVCAAINAGVDSKDDDWPVFVSLECHVELAGQGELVRIMKEAWGEKLVTGRVEGSGEGGSVTPRDLRNRVVMMIEYYPPEDENKPESDSDSSSQSSNASDSQKAKTKTKISDELAALGIYALSIKPKKNWLQQELEHLHVLINISESSLLSLLPHQLSELILHGQRHLRRVYPRGTRIMSDNLDPLVSWRAGSHFAALNWQEFDRGIQMNEAMFVGSGGWVPKPGCLRGAGGGTGGGRVGLAIDVLGLSSLPYPEGEDCDPKVRVQIYLYHESGEKEWNSKAIKCKKAASESQASGVSGDAMFNEACTWAFDADELAFIRIIVTHNDDHLAIFCSRLSHVQQGYRFVRLLDMKGKDSGATLLVNFIISTIT